MRSLFLSCFLFCFCSLPVAPLIAQEVSSPEPTRLSLPSDQKAKLATQWLLIEEGSAELKQLERDLKGVSGTMSLVLERRRATALNHTIDLSLEYCRKVVDLYESNYALEEHYGNALKLLEKVPPRILQSIDQLRDLTHLPDFTKPALEQIAIDRRFVEAIHIYIQLNQALLEACDMAERYGLEFGALRSEGVGYLERCAVNISVFLELALTEVRNLRASLAVMPDDLELKAKLRVSELRVKDIIKLLTESVESLRVEGLPIAQYQRQLLSATGAVTTMSLDVKVLWAVAQDWWKTMSGYIRTRGLDILFQVFLFFLIVFGFYRLSGLVRWLVNRALEVRHVRLTRLMRHMISSTARSLTILAGIFIALSQFNISLGPMLAGLGIAGFIVGFALQDSLSNFASGLMILFYKPFDVGDTVMVAEVRGEVSSMSLVNTTIRTFDNQLLVVPNNMIWQNVITNVTGQKIRRIDMEFGITYSEDIERVEAILHEVLAADERVLADPESRVMVGSFGDSSVNILCRPWVSTEDYWSVRWDLNKRIKQAFDREGVVIPFPQRDVHVYSQTVTGAAEPVDDQE